MLNDRSSFFIINKCRGLNYKFFRIILKLVECSRLNSLKNLNYCFSGKSCLIYQFSKVYDSLIKLCTDICKRNGKKKLLWLGDKNKTLNYSPKSDEMVITVHRWFANKSCPGNWLYERLGDLAAKVTANLNETAPADTKKDTLYRVRKTWNDAKTQKGAC